MKSILSFRLLILSFATLCSAEESQSPLEIVSPNKLYLVRLYPGWTVGNCEYDRAELIETVSKKVLYTFTPDSGFDADSVVWSPKSTHVAVYTRDHRNGRPLVIELGGTKGITECTFPDITLERLDQPENSGRWVQDWVKPTKWLTESLLVVSDSGLVAQHKPKDAALTYEYTVEIEFDADGTGTIKSTKCIEFTKTPYTDLN